MKVLEHEQINSMDLTKGSYIDDSQGLGVLLLIGSVILLVILAIAFGGTRFINPIGLLIVLGGTILSTTLQYSIDDIIRACKEAYNALCKEKVDPIDRILFFVDMADQVRKKGLLELERCLKRRTDPFLRKAVEVTVDGLSENDIRKVLETESSMLSYGSLVSERIIRTMATYAPAFGLIGTIVGLANLLGTLSDQQAMGGAMSVALMTTLYGALLSNLVLLPLAGRIAQQRENEEHLRSITIEGVISLLNGENSLMIEQKLHSYLPLRLAM